MKKLLNFFISSLLFVAGITACQTPLDVDDDAGIEKSKFTDVKQALQAIDILYSSGLPRLYGECDIEQGPMLALGGFLSGFFDNESKNNSSLCVHSQTLNIDSPDISSYLDKIWYQCYNGIELANVAILNIPITKELTTGQKSTYMAEARFFRALNYFYLVKMFGAIPIVTQPLTEKLESKTLLRASIKEIYDLIEEDLYYCIHNLSNKTFAENNFRITRPAAETLLADVYLTMSGYPLKDNRYQAAADVARSVIKGAKHQLETNRDSEEKSAYNTLRTTNNSPEYIYTYRNLTGSGISLASFSLSKEASSWGIIKVLATNSAYYPTRAFLNVYDSINDTRMHEKQFFHTFYKYNKDGRTIIETFPQTPYMWYDANTMEQTGNSSKDVSIYRYAEVLLIAAEAIAQTEGVTSEAVKYLVDVRARAYSKTNRLAIETILKSLDKNGFIKEVWIERMRELPFEMKIWSDIQRTRKYPLTFLNDKGAAKFVDIIGTKNPSGKIFELKHLLLPIPKSVLEKNKSMSQNLGYE